MLIKAGPTYIDGFPVKFNEDAFCICAPEDFCLPVHADDKLAFQFLAPVLRDVIVNGDFEDGINSWNTLGWTIVFDINTQNSFIQHATGNTYFLEQTGVLNINDFYQMTITIIGRTAGSVKVFGVGETVEISTNGTHVFFFQANTFPLQITPTSDFDGGLDDIIVQRVGDDFTVNLIDSDGNIEAVLAPTQTDRNVIMNTKWSDLTAVEDCYHVEVTNNELFIDEDFTEQGDWIFDDTISIASERLQYSETNPFGGTADAELPFCLEPGATYSVRFELTSADPTLTSVTIILGGTAGTPRPIAGTYTESITVGATQSLVIRFIGIGIGTSTIEFIELTKTSADGVSSCFKLDVFTCTKLMRYTNDEDAFGHLYTDFEHYLRIESDFHTHTYPNDKNLQLRSNGSKRNIYARGRVALRFDIAIAAFFVHDAMQKMFNHDTVLIDNVEYVSDEEYEMGSNEDGKVAPGRIEIEKASQPFGTNRDC